MTTFSFGLRPIAYSYCQWVTQHFKFLGIDGYQIGLMFVFLASLCGIAFLSRGRTRAVVNRFCPAWLYCLLLIATLFIARLPTFLAGRLNPDEGMFLAGAMKLRHYPVFWQSLDGTTSGPLNYYALTLLNLLGLPLDFATARLMNVLCDGGAIAVVYLIARLFMADWTARLTPLPPLAAAMAFRGPDSLHYSSECVPVLLVALGTWLLFAEYLGGRMSRLRCFGIGVVAALLPLAKPQAAPIAITIAVAGMAQVSFGRQEHKWRGVLYVAVGLAAVIACLLLYLLAFGLWGTFLQSYAVMIFLQANKFPPVSLEQFIRYCFALDFKWYEIGVLGFLLFVFATSYIPWARRKGYWKATQQVFQTALLAALLCCAGAWWLSPMGLRWPLVIPSLFVGLAAGAMRAVIQFRTAIRNFLYVDVVVCSIAAASLYAVYRPRTGYPHYLVFLIFPLALVGARAFAWSLRASEDAGGAGSHPTAVRPALLFVLCALALPWFFRSKELKPGFESEARMVAHPGRLDCAACPLVNQFAKAGDLITIWGWAPELYVLTDTMPASREPQTPYQMTMGGSQLDYFRRRYMDDLKLHPPVLFVDAVGPGQFAYPDRAANGFETFTELREYVTSNFYLAGDVGGVRVFARRGATAK